MDDVYPSCCDIEEGCFVGDAVYIDGNKSDIIGVDCYILKSFSGNIMSWHSYTCISGDERWWLVIFPDIGPYRYISTDRQTPTSFLPYLSGLAQLQSEGDSSLSDDVSAIATFEIGDGSFYAEEVFPHAPPLSFIGRPVSIESIHRSGA